MNEIWIHSYICLFSAEHLSSASRNIPSPFSGSPTFLSLFLSFFSWWKIHGVRICRSRSEIKLKIILAHFSRVFSHFRICKMCRCDGKTAELRWDFHSILRRAWWSWRNDDVDEEKLNGKKAQLHFIWIEDTLRFKWIKIPLLNVYWAFSSHVAASSLCFKCFPSLSAHRLDELRRIPF